MADSFFSCSVMIYFRHLKVSEVKADFVFVHLDFNTHPYQTDRFGCGNVSADRLLNWLRMRSLFIQ